MTNKNNYIKGITKSGFRFAIDKDRLETYELFELIAENESNPMVMPKILVLLLGEKQKNNLLDFLRDKKGLVNVKRVEEELTSIFEQVKPIKN